MNALPTEHEQKFALLLAALDAGETFVLLDPRVPGVEVPAGLGEGPRLLLKFSHRYDPDPVIGLTAETLSAVLSFGGVPFRVAVPLSAIVEVASKRLGTIVQFASPDPATGLAAPPRIARVPERPVLGIAQGGGETTEPRTGHLRSLARETLH